MSGDSKIIYSTETGEQKPPERKVTEREVTPAISVEAAAPLIPVPTVKRHQPRLRDVSLPVQVKRPANRDIHPLILRWMKQHGPVESLIEWRSQDSDGLWDCIVIHNPPTTTVSTGNRKAAAS